MIKLLPLALLNEVRHGNPPVVSSGEGDTKSRPVYCSDSLGHAVRSGVTSGVGNFLYLLFLVYFYSAWYALSRQALAHATGWLTDNDTDSMY